jgi:hypothetical protein
MLRRWPESSAHWALGWCDDDARQAGLRFPGCGLSRTRQARWIMASVMEISRPSASMMAPTK